jgi:hypothetical protein
MHVRAFCPLVLAFGCSLFALPARAASDDADRTLAPYFLVEDYPDAVETFPLEATHVRATVSGVIADVTVEQVYRNDGVVPISARYVFPGSTRAAVSGLTMQVGPSTKPKCRSKTATDPFALRSSSRSERARSAHP